MRIRDSLLKFLDRLEVPDSEKADVAEFRAIINEKDPDYTEDGLTQFGMTLRMFVAARDYIMANQKNLDVMEDCINEIDLNYTNAQQFRPK